MLAYRQGTALVTNDELIEKSATGQISTFLNARAATPATAALAFSNGVLRASDLAPTPGFTPVGLYKPLRIEIRQVYTGNHPRNFLGIGGKGMLVTSAMKGIITYDAAPRAVNFLREDTQQFTPYREVKATDVGTPLVFYTKALTSPSSVVTIEFDFQSFPTDLFTNLSKVFSAAGSLPIFAPASAYLLAGGVISSIIGDLGQALLNTSPAFQQTEPISFITPGTNLPTANFALLLNDGADPSVLRDYKIDDSGSLVAMSDSQPYKGPEPYAVIFLDGAEIDELDAFQPTAASAAILARFLNLGSNATQPADSLISAIKLANDFQFRTQADAIATQIKALPPGSDVSGLQAKYKALVANIQTNILKPPAA